MWAEASGHRAADHASIAHAVGNWSAVTGRTYAEQLELSCHGLRNGAARVDRETAADPEQWATVQARADAYFAGTLADPCKGRAQFWGGPVVDAKRIAAGLAAGAYTRVDCGKTANHFFRSKR